MSNPGDIEPRLGTPEQKRWIKQRQFGEAYGVNMQKLRRDHDAAQALAKAALRKA